MSGAITVGSTSSAMKICAARQLVEEELRHHQAEDELERQGDDEDDRRMQERFP